MLILSYTLADILTSFNLLLAGFGMVWAVRVAMFRRKTGDSYGGSYYAVGFILILFGIVIGNGIRLKDHSVIITPATPFITAGLVLIVVGAVKAMMGMHEHHNGHQQ